MSELARYILRSMDVANGMTDAGFPPDREAALGERAVELGEALLARARERGRSGEPDLPPDSQFTLSG